MPSIQKNDIRIEFAGYTQTSPAAAVSCAGRRDAMKRFSAVHRGSVERLRPD